MTMTDAEAKALALVNEAAQDRLYPIWPSFERSNGTVHEALCLAIEREAATEARHAAELRELKERFSEAARSALAEALKAATCASQRGAIIGPILAPFILPAPDPLVEALASLPVGFAGCVDGADALRAAIEARGGKIVWEKTNA